MKKLKKLKKRIKVNKQIVISIIIFTAIVIATAIVVMFGKGYRFSINSENIGIQGTGLLVAKSLPDGAQVYVDGKLKTATDNTINLPPGEYEVKIQKEGYLSWEKRIKVEGEIVSTADALLVPIAPKLESITELGAENPTIDPTITRIAFNVSEQDINANGIYFFDMKSNPLIPIQGSATQLVDDSIDVFSLGSILWSPEGKEIIATISADRINPDTYLLETNRSNSPPNNVTLTLDEVNEEWTELKEAQDKSFMDSLPRSLQKMVNENFEIMSISPDQNKILYTASRSASLPIIIKPRLFGVNSTPEVRSIREGQTYVYDIKEDRNYRLNAGNFQGAYSWHTDSKHFIFVKDNEVHIMDFDGLNDRVVYAGPFDANYIFPWPDATRIVILTNLGNKNSPANLYTISLK